MNQQLAPEPVASQAQNGKLSIDFLGLQQQRRLRCRRDRAWGPGALVRVDRRAHIVRQAAGCARAAAASPARQGAVAEAHGSGTGVPCPRLTNLAYGLPDGQHFAICFHMVVPCDE